MDKTSRRASIPRARTAPGRQTPLLARDMEREALDVLLAAVREGLSATLVIAGEAGMGKTRLLHHTAEGASDLRVLRVTGAQSERHLGFAGLHRLLLPFLDRVATLPRPQQEALGAAFGLVSGPPADRFTMGLATLTLLAQVAAERPVLCAVDDVQWLDPESVGVLAFVGRRLHADGIGLLLTVREGNEPVELEGLPTIRLAGLGGTPALELLAATVAGDLSPAVAGRIVAETGGNPLALISLAAELASDQLAGRSSLPVRLPAGPRLEEHFLRRVRVLPRPTQLLVLLTAVAPLDSPAMLWRAAASLGLSPADADAAVAEQVLLDEPHLRLRHPLVGSAVYGGADGADRRRVHAAVGQAADSAADEDRRAWHRAAACATPDEEVAADLERSAQRAHARGGYSARAQFLTRAAELTPEPLLQATRLLAAAQAHLIAADPVAAQSLLERATPELSDPVLQARARRLGAALEVYFTRLPAVPVMLLGAVEMARSREERLTRDLLFEALQIAFVTGRRATGTSLLDVAGIALRGPGAPEEATVPDLLLDAFATRVAAGHAQAVPLLREVIAALATRTDLAETDMPLAMLGSVAADELWDLAGRAALLSNLDRADRASGALIALRVTLQATSLLHVWSGNFVAAMACHSEADELGAAVGAPAQSAHRVEMLAWQGLAAETREALGIIRTLWDAQLGIGVAATFGLAALTTLELGLGNYAAALSAARQVFEEDVPGYGGRILPDLIEAAVRSGDLTVTATALRRLEARAGAAGTPWALGVLARSRALLAADDDAGGMYAEALALLGTTRLLPEVARTHLLFGEWLRRQRRRSEAREHLRTAHTLFADMGAAAFCERARTELLATGERARSRTPSTLHDLTPQELRIAVLAAGGATNVEIASRLYITTSTVEYHLNKVFRKLDLTSRRQLREALRPGPVD